MNRDTCDYCSKTAEVVTVEAGDGGRACGPCITKALAWFSIGTDKGEALALELMKLTNVTSAAEALRIVQSWRGRLEGLERELARVRRGAVWPEPYGPAYSDLGWIVCAPPFLDGGLAAQELRVGGGWTHGEVAMFASLKEAIDAAKEAEPWWEAAR